MKKQLDIIKMHDMIDEILHNEQISKEIEWDDNRAKTEMVIIKRVLCWVLEHDEGRWLQDNMDRLNKALEDRGYSLYEVKSKPEKIQ